MRCKACDNPMTDRDSTRKFASGSYVDLCEHCFDTIKDQVYVLEVPDSDDEVEYE